MKDFFQQYALRGFFSKGSSDPGGGSDVVIRNQNKEIDENGTYKADAGYTGLGIVSVNVPIPDVDAAIEAELEVIENGTY